MMNSKGRWLYASPRYDGVDDDGGGGDGGDDSGGVVATLFLVFLPSRSSLSRPLWLSGDFWSGFLDLAVSKKSVPVT